MSLPPLQYNHGNKTIAYTKFYYFVKCKIVYINYFVYHFNMHYNNYMQFDFCLNILTKFSEVAAENWRGVAGSAEVNLL